MAVCLCTVTEYITMGKDIALGVAALVTATVAVRGLHTWNRQLKGTASFDAAKDLAAATYRLRTAIERCRSVVELRGGNYLFSPDDDGWKVIAKGHTALKARYDVGLNAVGAALVELETSALTAEALWGGAVKTKVKVLRVCCQMLKTNVDMLVGEMNGSLKVSEEVFAAVRDIVGTMQTEKNPGFFSKQVADAIAGIEEVLIPHLRK